MRVVAFFSFLCRWFFSNEKNQYTRTSDEYHEKFIFKEVLLLLHSKILWWYKGSYFSPWDEISASCGDEALSFGSGGILARLCILRYFTSVVCLIYGINSQCVGGRQPLSRKGDAKRKVLLDPECNLGGNCFVDDTCWWNFCCSI